MPFPLSRDKVFFFAHYGSYRVDGRTGSGTKKTVGIRSLEAKESCRHRRNETDCP